MGTLGLEWGGVRSRPRCHAQKRACSAPEPSGSVVVVAPNALIGAPQGGALRGSPQALSNLPPLEFLCTALHWSFSSLFQPQKAGAAWIRHVGKEVLAAKIISTHSITPTYPAHLKLLCIKKTCAPNLGWAPIKREKWLE